MPTTPGRRRRSPTLLLSALLLLLPLSSLVSALQDDWTWSRTAPAAPIYFLNTPTSQVSVDLTNSPNQYPTPVVTNSTTLKIKTWYKITAEGSYWTGTEVADAVCFYTNNGNQNKHHCEGLTSNSYTGIFSRELGLRCSDTAYLPVLFWTGYSTSAQGCPSYSNMPNNVYTTYIYSATGVPKQLDWFMNDVYSPNNVRVNTMTATFTNGTTGAMTVWRDGITIKIYEGLSPTTITQTNVVTLPPVTQTLPAVTQTLPAVTQTQIQTQTLPAVTQTLPAVTQTQTQIQTLPAVTQTQIQTQTLPAVTQTTVQTQTLAAVTQTQTTVQTQTLAAVTQTQTQIQTQTLPAVTQTTTATLAAVTQTTTATAVLTNTLTLPAVTQTTTRTKSLNIYAVAGGWGKELVPTTATVI